MKIVVVSVIVIAQCLGLVIGLVQGIRYIKTDPLGKALPWLLIGMLGSPVVQIVNALWK